ncbi:MAG: type IV pilus assembly protein PilW [Gammaproteobacteria bacterium]|jgi:type IV pilus assembly protein PilW
MSYRYFILLYSGGITMSLKTLKYRGLKNMRAQAGISLVEILVSLVISLFLLGGIISVYVGNTTTYRFANALSQVQENGRFALDTITQDLRAVGDWGCINFNPANVANINNTLNIVGANAALNDFLGNPPVLGTNDAGGLGTSDTITISGSQPGQVNIAAPFSTTAQTFVTVNTVGPFVVGDVALITRCGPNDGPTVEAEIFRVTGIVNASGRLTHATALSQIYRNDATLKRLQTVTYSLAVGNGGEPTLWRSVFGVNLQLIQGIEDMQILYGIDTDGVNTAGQNYANQYVTANNVANFRTVVSIRIMLLVRSTDAFVTDTPQVIPFNGAADANPGDRRIRQVFTTTIALRNRAGIAR